MQLPLSGFRERLRLAIKTSGNSLCTGIDPEWSRIPVFFQSLWQAKGAQYGLELYADSLLQASIGNVAAVKFQSAFFEAYGAPGFQALQNALAKARAAGLLTILDAKRGDIASTMHAYGVMAFEEMQADALTVTPYLGFDVIEPLSSWLQADRGVYVVWISSNKAGGFIQDMQATYGQKQASVATHLRDELIRQFQQTGLSEALGFVLGATKTSGLRIEDAAVLAPYPLLMPGVGAQGGELSAPIKQVMSAQTLSLVPQSRSLSSSTEFLTWQIDRHGGVSENDGESLKRWQAFVQENIMRACHELRLD